MKEPDLSSNPSKEQPPPVATEGSLHKAERGQSVVSFASLFPSRFNKWDDPENLGKVSGDQ